MSAETFPQGRAEHITADRDAVIAATAAAAAIADKKGVDITLLDVSELLVVTDLFLIATGTSTRHVRTLIEAVEESLRLRFARRPLRREGEDRARWVLLDYGDFVVHVFDDETRSYYELERLWADAPSFDVEQATPEGAAGGGLIHSPARRGL